MKNLFLTIVLQIVAMQIGYGQINNKRIEFPIQGTDLESFNIPIGKLYGRYVDYAGRNIWTYFTHIDV